MNMIISMSLGYDDASAPSNNVDLGNAISTAGSEDIPVFVSAGNSGPNPNITGFPADFDSPTSVAAAGWNGYTGAYGISERVRNIPEDSFSDLLIAPFPSSGKLDVTGIGNNWSCDFRITSLLL